MLAPDEIAQATEDERAKRAHREPSREGQKRKDIPGGLVQRSEEATSVLAPWEGLQFYLEPFIFLTRHKLNAVDDPTGTWAKGAAPGIQIGSRYSF